MHRQFHLFFLNERDEFSSKEKEIGEEYTFNMEYQH